MGHIVEMPIAVELPGFSILMIIESLYTESVSFQARKVQ
jgi:hypothetical protein